MDFTQVIEDKRAKKCDHTLNIFLLQYTKYYCHAFGQNNARLYICFNYIYS